MVVWYPRPCFRKNFSTSGSRRSVICGLGPGQRMALAKKSGPNSGESDKSMSSSHIASIRFQSVIDRFFEVFAFTVRCLSGRNDSNNIRLFFGEHDLSQSSSDPAESEPS